MLRVLVGTWFDGGGPRSFHGRRTDSSRTREVLSHVPHAPNIRNKPDYSILYLAAVLTSEIYVHATLAEEVTTQVIFNVAAASGLLWTYLANNGLARHIYPCHLGFQLIKLLLRDKDIRTFRVVLEEAFEQSFLATRDFMVACRGYVNGARMSLRENVLHKPRRIRRA